VLGGPGSGSEGCGTLTNLLEVRNLRVTYRSGRGDLIAVDGVDLGIKPGHILGLVGESGSGKSSLARALVHLIPASAGSILLDGLDVTHVSGGHLRQLRKRVQMVFQDPYTSLNPRMSVGETLDEALAEHRRFTRVDRQAEVARLLTLVGLKPEDASSFPFQFSGGQRQRVAIARALAVQPDLIIADEITSALDVSVQASVLNLLRDLRQRLGLAFLLISHNLAVVHYLCDSVAVMHLGKIVEQADAKPLFDSPRHPYTRVLLDSVPKLRGRQTHVPIEGDVPDPHDPPSGCRFRTRCAIGPLSHPERTICKDIDPHTVAGNNPHQTACHFPLEGRA
jgi:peptide/nickel transport system ATP-binding protein